jgi:quinoprotein glucose dehydrogenase
MMWGISPFDQLWCRIKFKEADYRGPLTPPGLRPTVNYPGYAGGTSWGGISVDPQRMLMVMNINRFATYGRLMSREEANRLTRAMSAKADSAHSLGSPMYGTPFAAQFSPFLSPLGVPCQQPPYGMIGVVDLKTHALKWSRSFGTARHSGPLGLQTYLPLPLGTPNTGGSLVTRSGLVFIGATQERRFRAIDIESGRELWSTAIPAGAHATPMTYRSERSGKQFVVIASGGSPLMHSGRSDAIMAFALPKR